MVGAKTGVAATHINKIESHAHLTHCHGPTLQLAVSETIKAIKIMRSNLDGAFQILYGSKIIEKNQILYKNGRSLQ